MSDNQKPSRDPGEEVCEVEGCGLDQAAHRKAEFQFTNMHSIQAHARRIKETLYALVRPGEEERFSDLSAAIDSLHYAEQLSGDSGQSKPAPKAPVRGDADALSDFLRLAKDANGQFADFRVQAAAAFIRLHQQAPVREDREGWLTEDEVEAQKQYLTEMEPDSVVRINRLALEALCRMALSALKSKEKP